MAEYQFADDNGNIIQEDYSQSTKVKIDAIERYIKEGLNEFPISFNISKVDGFKDVLLIEYLELNNQKVYVCVKQVTPGGRSNIDDEQRLQTFAESLNFVYEQSVNGNQGVVLGIYKKNKKIIFCTWDTSPSSAEDKMPISKQIKIYTIASAIKEGFSQQEIKGGKYVCAFRPAFWMFYLNNKGWLHSKQLNSLNGVKEALPPKTDTTSIPFNCIFFGAPGTGKSFNLNKNKDELISSENNYERVTFHPDYSYANFVGCYKPIMRENKSYQSLDDNKKDILNILHDNNKTAQDKYDILYEKFKNNGEGLTRIPILLGLYCDGDFTIKKNDGSDAANSSVEKNHGKAIRPYVTLLPDSDTDEIAYEYIPGPFMRILTKALRNSEENYLLIIEEINRANIAAVFGDVFQLLDRDKSGNSEYEIQTSEDMRKYLKKELGIDMPTIRIPNNMYIWATMNSADQGVYPMDTAFKRRWNFKYFDIDNGESSIQDKVVEICGESVNWNRLRKAINNELSGNKINEDKLMGAHFLPESVLEDHEKFINAFKNKVIMYLFEDAAKQKRSTIFSGCSDHSRFSSICKEFDEKGIKIFSENVQHGAKE